MDSTYMRTIPTVKLVDFLALAQFVLNPDNPFHDGYYRGKEAQLKVRDLLNDELDAMQLVANANLVELQQKLEDIAAKEARE